MLCHLHDVIKLDCWLALFIVNIVDVPASNSRAINSTHLIMGKRGKLIEAKCRRCFRNKITKKNLFYSRRKPTKDFHHHELFFPFSHSLSSRRHTLITFYASLESSELWENKKSFIFNACKIYHKFINLIFNPHKAPSSFVGIFIFPRIFMEDYALVKCRTGKQKTSSLNGFHNFLSPPPRVKTILLRDAPTLFFFNESFFFDAICM